MGYNLNESSLGSIYLDMMSLKNDERRYSILWHILGFSPSLPLFFVHSFVMGACVMFAFRPLRLYTYLFTPRGIHVTATSLVGCPPSVLHLLLLLVLLPPLASNVHQGVSTYLHSCSTQYDQDEEENELFFFFFFVSRSRLSRTLHSYIKRKERGRSLLIPLYKPSGEWEFGWNVYFDEDNLNNVNVRE